MKQGKVIAICKSKKKGTAKSPIARAYLKKNWGLAGDAHAGTEKQISLLMLESVNRLEKEIRVKAYPGVFAENILTKNIDLLSLPVGSNLKIGEKAVIEIIRIGKEKNISHSYRWHGVSLLPTKGVFAKVVKSGWIKKGDKVALADKR